MSHRPTDKTMHPPQSIQGLRRRDLLRGSSALAAASLALAALANVTWLPRRRPRNAQHRLHRRRRSGLEGRRLPRLRHQDAEHRRARAGGARLEQFYVQPMCTPTRAALMTGRYPFRYGLQTAVIPTRATYGLPTDEWLLPQALKDAGYKTAIIGKWHLGHADRKYWPRQRGFDYQYGAHDRRDRLLHARASTACSTGSATTSPSRRRATRRTLLGNDAVELINEHDPADAAVLVSRLQRAAHALSGAAGISRSLQEHRGPDAPRLCGDGHLPWTTRSAGSSPRSTRRACATTR